MENASAFEQNRLQFQRLLARTPLEADQREHLREENLPLPHLTSVRRCRVAAALAGTLEWLLRPNHAVNELQFGNYLIR
jgi:hypothetical protein